MFGTRKKAHKMPGTFMPYFGNKAIIEPHLDKFKWTVTRIMGNDKYDGIASSEEEAMLIVEKKFGDGWTWEK